MDSPLASKVRAPPPYHGVFSVNRNIYRLSSPPPGAHCNIPEASRSSHALSPVKWVETGLHAPKWRREAQQPPMHIFTEAVLGQMSVPEENGQGERGVPQPGELVSPGGVKLGREGTRTIQQGRW